MPLYSTSPVEADELLAEVMREYHQPLIDAEVTVTLLWVTASRNKHGEIVGNGLMLHGYPAAGVCKKTSVKDRVAGLSDAIISIDGDVWKTLDQDERIALFDHELHHIELIPDDEGKAIRDDHDRPVIELRKHDIVIGGFSLIAERHKSAALEVQTALDIKTRYGQLLFDFALPTSAEDDETTITFESGGKKATVTGKQLRKIAKGRADLGQSQAGA